MYEEIGKILLCLRKSWRMSREEVADQMTLLGIPTSSQTINSWEHDVTRPSSKHFLGLCEIYKVRDVLSTFADIENPQRKFDLNHEGWRKVEEFAQILEASGMFKMQDCVFPFLHRFLPVYVLSVSNENCLILLSRDYELVQVNSEIPANANFGIKLIGDSMEPRFKNHEIVWVQQQKSLKVGEIGVFIYKGSVYVRQWQANSNLQYLRAFNSAYSTITVFEGEDLQLVGRVIVNDDSSIV